ncbi:MAG: glycosyltransferase family 4 protein, partial [Cyanobacteria bacterium]|nr:glycosyltransferase family 4 protein [Cyanobacteriota bacterium]MDW8202279.1 glycosyltransferase family 4 protein [Cyanobacteriota bacterium SKYGB_h_bin112]
ITCIYELPIAFYRTSQTIQQEEADRFPQFAQALVAAREPSWKIKRKYQELQLADRIIVPSSFVLASVTNEGIPPERITVIPYGAPIDYFQPQPKPDSVFRALFVGRVGPRKGVHYLLEAWRSLQLVNAELMMVGINEFPSDWFSRHAERVHYLPSVPHASLQQYYSQASVLVLPSLVEGMSLVLLEAMACGIPLITTPNAAGLDLITDGVEGFIVPIRDVDALKTRLEWCYQHPEQLAAMGRNARRKAEELSWTLYRDRIRQTVMAALS